MADSIFLRRVLLKNYRSIANCSVELGPLSFLVGPDGAGKSNFLDALRFVTESLNTSLDHALRERGGIAEVRRRSSGHPTHFGVRLEFELPDGEQGHYAFRVGALPKCGFEVQREECCIHGSGALGLRWYRVESGAVIDGNLKIAPAAARNTQVIVTSHSPDLLDDKDIRDDWVLAVVNENGETRIGPLNEADRTLMRDRPFTAGELLRQGALTPDLQGDRQTPPEQMELFGRPEV